MICKHLMFCDDRYLGVWLDICVLCHSKFRKSCVKFVARVFRFALRFLCDVFATLRLLTPSTCRKKRGTKGGSVARKQHNLSAAVAIAFFILFYFFIILTSFVCMSVGLL